MEHFNKIIDMLRTGELATRYENLIDVQEHPSGELVLLNYTENCQYLGAWDDVTLRCRGLIINTQSWEIAALPFQKFFNLGEKPESSFDALPNEAFAVYEKLDGSLCISYRHGKEIALATRGSFTSSQALQGTNFLKRLRNIEKISEHLTCLFEVIFKATSCVSSYDFEGLVLLSAFDRITGRELKWEEVIELADSLGCRTARVYPFGDFAEIIESRSALPANFEGYVVRFDSGYRVKIKGDAYLALNKLAAGLTETRILEAMADGTIGKLRQESPEEFWGDIDQAINEIQRRATALERKVTNLFDQAPKTSDRKNFALWVQANVPAELRVIFFHLYDNKPSNWYKYL